MALDQTAAGRSAGHYDRLLIDRNHDGDMKDVGEVIEGRLEPGPSPDRKTMRFDVGDLYLRGKGEDRTFQIRELVVHADAAIDPTVTFTVKMDHRMFEECSYALTGPFDSTMKFSPDVTKMPTLNLTPEIATGPGFGSKTIRVVLSPTDTPFRIGQQRLVHLTCVTGDPESNEHVFAFENAAFAKPLIATLIYKDEAGVPRGREFELQDWSGATTFAGQITIPNDARPGTARLVANFSEKIASTGGGETFRHFTQIVPGGADFIDAKGEKRTASGWRQQITLVR